MRANWLKQAIDFYCGGKSGAHLILALMLLRKKLLYLGESLLSLLYPSLCEGCGAPLVASEEVLCISCEHQLPETGYHNQADNDTCQRFAGRVPFSYATSLGWFVPDGLLQHLIHGMKYRQKKANARYLGHILGLRLSATYWISEIDIIVPVPLHTDKERERGYNQSTIIALGMSKATGIPIHESLILRNRKTASQTNKTRTERVANMARAFTVNDAYLYKTKHILLVDDVLTTGATLEACALAFLEAGITKISFATIGIAVS